MGKYINRTTKKALGESYKDKVQGLIEDGATVIIEVTFQPNLVCVINNGFFAAAGYAYSMGEFTEFMRNDGRTKTWLLYPNAEQMSK